MVEVIVKEAIGLLTKLWSERTQTEKSERSLAVETVIIGQGKEASGLLMKYEREKVGMIIIMTISSEEDF